MKAILLTHDDLDGIGCAVVMHKLLPLQPGDTLDVIYVGFRSIDKAVEKALTKNYDLIYITDVSPTHEMVHKLESSSKNWYLIDHHKTNLDLQGSRAMVNIEACATLNLMRYMIGVYGCPSNELSQLLGRFCLSVDAWDRWVLDSPYRADGEYLNEITYLGSAAVITERFIQNLDPFEDRDTQLQVGALRTMREISCNKILENYDDQEVYHDIFGSKFKVIITNDHISYLGNRALDKWPQIDYVMMIQTTNGGLSFRSRKGFDVTEVAKLFDGGGHAQAAGGLLKGDNKVEARFVNDFLGRQLKQAEADLVTRRESIQSVHKE